jgi:LAO/AO transport system kinase
MADLTAALDRHRAWGRDTDEGRAQRRTRLGEEVRDALREALIDAAVRDLGEEIEEAVRDVDAHSVDPYTATERLLEAFRTREGRESRERGPRP